MSADPQPAVASPVGRVAAADDGGGTDASAEAVAEDPTNGDAIDPTSHAAIGTNIAQ
jgi:hypothetical protein